MKSSFSNLFDMDTNQKKMIMAFYLFSIFMVMPVYFLYLRNPALFYLDKNTLSFLNKAINLLVILVVPIFFGCLGSLARVTVSGLDILGNVKLIFSSGLIACISWIGIQSKLLVILFAPHLNRTDLITSVNLDQLDIYVTAFVSASIGMFASNLFLFAKQKIELVLAKQADSN